MKIRKIYHHFQVLAMYAVFLVFLSQGVYAQAPNILSGGSGGGAAMAINACPAVIVNTCAGGAGDGTMALISNCPAVAVSVCKGGSGDGGGKIYNSCPAVLVNAFAGGSNSGDASLYQNCSLASVNLALGGSGGGDAKVYDACAAVLVNLFQGGIFDGSSVNAITCPAAANPLVGGSGDGAASLYASCPAVTLNIFAGGNSSGSGKLWNTCTALQPNIVYGGTGDGSASLYNSCPKVLTNVFAGGSYDGHASAWDLCSFASVNVFSGGSNDGSGTVWDACSKVLVNYTRGGSCSGSYAIASVCTGTWLTHACFCSTCCPIPVAAGNVSGPSAICDGQKSVAFSVPAIQDASGYQWLLPPGANISSGGNTNSISVNFSTGTSSFKISVLGTSSCGNGIPSSDFSVTVSPLPAAAGSISGSTSLCQGDSGINYSVAPIANATSYNWTLPSGVSVASGNNTNSIYLDFGPNASSGNIVVEGVDSCGKGVSSTLSLSVSPLPDPATSISGKTPVCQSENGVVYSVGAIANASSYNWIVPAGASIVSGANTNSITVDFSSSASSGNLSVEGVNACGNGVISTLSITVDQLPDTASPVSGPGQVCQGENNVVYSIPPITGVSTYNWILPSGASIVSGLNTNAITVSYSVSASSGSLDVYGVNACGNGVSSTLSILVNQLPPADAGADQDICDGQSALIGGAAVPGNSYSWLPASGLDFDNISNPNASPTITTTYTLTETSPSTACFATNNVTVTVYANPLPQITQNLAVLECTAASTYQWYVNGNLITGATSQNYSPGPDGDYTVEVTDSNSCQGVSAPYTFISTSQSGISTASPDISVYPNPHTSSFVVSGRTYAGDGLSIRLMSMQNQELVKRRIADGKYFSELITTTDLPAGIYLLSIHSSHGLLLKKIIKIN